MHPIVLLLVQISLVLAACRVVGFLAARLGQPQVVGEMLAGILLGPTLLGVVAPDALGAGGWLFPTASLGALNVLSQVGIILFLFLIGLELDPKLIRGRGHAAVVISQTSIIAPLLLGIGLTFYLFHRHFGGAHRFLPVALFMGAAMSVTAFPVLARILTERNLTRTRVGAIAITCAAVDDMSAWCLLAFVTAVANAEGQVGRAVVTLAMALAYAGVMLLAIRPFLVRLQGVFDRKGRLSQNVFALIMFLVLLSALTTEAIGIHALFGAFMIGAVMPKGTRFVGAIVERLEDFVVVFLLPLFFAYTGLKTQIGLLNSWGAWGDAALIILVACAGKFGGATVAARACGLPLREASAIGILMNTRGLMELVILSIGRDLGVITPPVFAMMVIMALVTTALTTPVLAWVYPRKLFGPIITPIRTPTASPSVRKDGKFTVLIPVSQPKSGGPLLNLANLVTSGSGNGKRILALHLRPPVDREAYRSGLDDSIVPSTDESLAPLISYGKQHKIPVDPITFTSVDVPGDIAQVSAEREADLVLIGFHNPVFGKALLGGTVASVLRSAETDVAVFIDRGFTQAKRVLVPFLGTSHDRLALELAGRVARAAGATITVLHVISPVERVSATPTGARQAVDRVFDDPTQPNAVEFRTVERETPVSAVLDAAGEDFDLVVIGVAETWGLESQLFGLRPERIARDCPTSLMVVRKFSTRMS
jgi:Kef-type K+ transport system membrane component KefB/nucleotide-binding universal stress UspA family protein